MATETANRISAAAARGGPLAATAEAHRIVAQLGHAQYKATARDVLTAMEGGRVEPLQARLMAHGCATNTLRHAGINAMTAQAARTEYRWFRRNGREPDHVRASRLALCVYLARQEAADALRCAA